MNWGAPFGHTLILPHVPFPCQLPILVMCIRETIAAWREGLLRGRT